MQIIKYKYWYLILSAVVLIPGIISLAVFKLNLAIDFTGGSVFEYSISELSAPKNTVASDVKNIMQKDEVTVEQTQISKTTLTVRTKTVETKKILQLTSDIQKKYKDAKQESFQTVGPAIGAETTKNAFLALLVASVGILLYIAYAFRNIPKPYSSFKFGASALIAMLHDALVVLGIFSLLGHFLKVEIDALFITALLTVIGFSVHDTIVVFDRIRENLNKLPHSWRFEEVVNYSVVETLNRSVATSLTVIITLTALLLLGGESIKYFSLALLVGIVSGTYSSIFNAAPILVIWEEWNKKKRTQ
ncbi:MAG TPA: protein translocase subunit SecF [Candidatus Saccharimonadales bacterium]|nr:protein translocase subunit SecF [Candidatus Saccharimonadales bacterium]